MSLNKKKFIRILILLAIVLNFGCHKQDDVSDTVPAGNSATTPGGPYQHKIISATSNDGLNWTTDAGIRLLHASVPCAVADDNKVFLYYVDADRGQGMPESVGCAVTTDGLNFQKQLFNIAGLGVRKAVDPSIMKDSDGNFRLYYLASNASGDPASETGLHEIHLATSRDGVNFTSQGSVFRYEGLVDPDVFFYKGTWFMYVYSITKGETVIATSADGKDFTYKQAMIPKDWGTVAPLLLDDGKLRLYAFEQKVPVGNSICSFLSTNGIDWTQDPGKRLTGKSNEQLTDPYVVKWKGIFRMYYKTNL